MKTRGRIIAYLKDPAFLKFSRLMKLMGAFMLLFCLHVSAGGFTQDRITLNLESVDLKKVLAEIQRKSDYRFLYNQSLISNKPKVNVHAINQEVTEVLNSIFSGIGIGYQVLDNKLVVLKASVNGKIEVREIRVTGKVTGDNGEVLTGVSVTVKGTNIGTTTDANGNYSISAPDGSTTLVFSYVGYESKEVAIAGQTTINVTLAVSKLAMDEVVVIGYGTAAKRDLTGSIAKVSGKEIADKPNTNPISSLQSKVAGLSIVNSGTPGVSPDVRIRGTISIGSVKPLYVVDGIFTDNIDYINPNDIESIEILKDPSSLAIFGVFGAPGVIAVTTKRAKAGQVLVNFNTSYGMKKMADKIEMANAEEFKMLLAEEGMNRFNETGATAINNFVANQMAGWTGNTDWVDAMTRTAHFNSNNISVTGSTDRNKFYFGVGYSTDEGLVKHVRYDRINLSLNDEFKVSKFLKLGFTMNGSREKFPYGGAAGQLAQAKRVAPIVPAGTMNVFTKNPYGTDSANYNLYYGVPVIQNTLNNPLNELENNWDKTRDFKYRMVGSGFAELNFLKYLNLKGTLYADLSNQDSRFYTPLYDGYNPEIPGVYNVNILTGVRQEKTETRRFQQDYVLTYKQNFSGHGLTFTAGFTTSYLSFSGLYGNVGQKAGTDPIPNDSRFWYVSNGFGDNSTQSSSSYAKEAATASGLARILYNYKNKYYFNASFRRDGSSLIYNPDTRTQNFWAVGAAWEISKEDFMADQKLFNFLKLKGSIGVLGNQNTYGTDYPYFPTISAGNTAVFGNNVFPSFSNNYLVSKDLKWETVHAKEVGLEFAALANRLHGEIAYYNKETQDMWAYLRPPGVLPTLGNLGAVLNKGFEFTAGWDQKISRDFSMTINGNLTTFKNKVTKLDYDLPADEQFPNQTKVGYPIGYFYGYVVDGVYQTYNDKLSSPAFTDFSYGPGDLKYKDLNGDGKIDGSDKTLIGNPTPDFTYGGSVNFMYKNFNLGIDVGGVYGNEIYRYWNTSENVFSVYNFPKYQLERWHGEGTSNWVPLLDQTHKINRLASTFGIEDGSYFRLRNIQLGYNFSPEMLSGARIKNARIYVNVQNLKTWRKNLGYSPEFGGGYINGQPATSFGIDIGDANSAIPVVYTAGININF